MLTDIRETTFGFMGDGTRAVNPEMAGMLDRSLERLAQDLYSEVSGVLSVVRCFVSSFVA